MTDDEPQRAGSSVFPDAGRRAMFVALADALIPAGHGMPAASTILDDTRVAFVLQARPDLTDPLWAALAAPAVDDPEARLDQLSAEHPELLAALKLVVVAGYYADPTVRERIGYPGQVARPVQALDYPPYLLEGLLDQVIERGPIWRDPATPESEGDRT